MKNERGVVVLERGEVYRRQKFGPNTVSRGAILFACEWDGGRFERGLFVGGMFRSGEFTGGFFYGGCFLDAKWIGGVWEGGFDRSGIFRPRNDSPDKR